ncbi:MAG: hypothetical protein PHF05_05800 [Candidatus Izemoplasmatales bacterium]|nr:hypothetical protein [Candidatus Izemoplasmatales bacterium]
MKNASSKELYAISAIVIILLIFGVKSGFEFISSLNPFINLPKIAFAGFISFAIVGGIMTIGRSAGIWFGKLGGSILYAVVLFIVGFILF